MKKIAAGATATVFAVAGLSALTVAPASAAPFPDCPSAYAAGVANIPSTSDQYSDQLDRDQDGIGCDNPPADFVPAAPVDQPIVIADPPATEAWAWDNCSEAFAAGVSNIPAGTPGYGTHLDSDLDGIGCELNGDDDAAFPYSVDPWGETSTEDGWEHTQVEQMPAGGADTGVPVAASTVTPGLVVLSALALAAFAGSGLLLRRAIRA